MTSKRPIVGIIHSESNGLSLESKNLAHFFAGNLALTGHATVQLVALNQDGSQTLPSLKRMSILNNGTKKAVEVPVR